MQEHSLLHNMLVTESIELLRSRRHDLVGWRDVLLLSERIRAFHDSSKMISELTVHPSDALAKPDGGTRDS